MKIERRVGVGDMCCETSNGCCKRVICEKRTGVVRGTLVEGGVERDKVGDDPRCDNGRYSPVEENSPEGTSLKCAEGWVDAGDSDGAVGGEGYLGICELGERGTRGKTYLSVFPGDNEVENI